MSSSASSDSGGGTQSGNSGWQGAPGTTCVMNPKMKNEKVEYEFVLPDDKCDCHETCGTCGVYRLKTGSDMIYAQTDEDCLTCYPDGTYKPHKAKYLDGTGPCTKKETTTASKCKALDGVNYKNLVTQGSCKSSWSSTYCTAGTEYAGCPSACDGDSNGNWCMVEGSDSNWCYCNPTESTPALAPAPGKQSTRISKA